MISLQLTEKIKFEILPLVNKFRTLQEPSGRVVGDLSRAEDLLLQMREPVSEVYAHLGMETCFTAFESDIDDWLIRGLGEVPAFDNSLRAYITPPDGCLSFFIGAYSCTNGEAPVGFFLECFIAERQEPQGLIRLIKDFPNPHYFTQIGRLLTASDGLLRGNCISFFPENIAVKEKVKNQEFALFFLNKSQQIYYESTLPLVENILPGIEPLTRHISTADSYEALGLWSYLHEYYHNSGPRPLNANLRAKMNFFAGILEEIKVDAQTILCCLQDEHPLAKEVMEFILFERLFRYARQPDPTNNFDAGTGFYLFEWLYRNNYGIMKTDAGLHVDNARVIEGLIVLTESILSLETIQDDALYKKAVKAMVRLLLFEGEFGARFMIPQSYMDIVGFEHPYRQAQFAHMEF